jgi:hypothetical protein
MCSRGTDTPWGRRGIGVRLADSDVEGAAVDDSVVRIPIFDSDYQLADGTLLVRTCLLDNSDATLRCLIWLNVYIAMRLEEQKLPINFGSKNQFAKMYYLNRCSMQGNRVAGFTVAY